MKFKVLGKTGGSVEDQEMAHYPGENGATSYQLWWTGGRSRATSCELAVRPRRRQPTS